MDLNKILGRLGEDVTMMFALEAEFLIEKGYPDEAVYLCLDGIKMFPKYVSGYTVLAKSYIVLGRLDEALQTIEDAIKKFPRHKTLINFAKFELGIEYEEFNLANFREIIERDDNFVFDLSTKTYRESFKKQRVAKKLNYDFNDNREYSKEYSKDYSIGFNEEDSEDYSIGSDEFEIPNRKFHNKVVESHSNIDFDLIRANQNISTYSISLDLNNLPSEYILDENIDIYKETNSTDFNTIPGLFDFKSSNNLIDIVIDKELKFDDFEINLGFKLPKLEYNFKNSNLIIDKNINTDKAENQYIDDQYNDNQNSQQDKAEYELDIDIFKDNDNNKASQIQDKIESSNDLKLLEDLIIGSNSSELVTNLSDADISNELFEELNELSDYYQSHKNQNDSLHLEVLETILDVNQNDFNLLTELESNNLNYEENNQKNINLDSFFENEFNKIVIQEVSEETFKTDSFDFDFDFDYLDKVTNQVAIGLGNLSNQVAIGELEESLAVDDNINFDTEYEVISNEATNVINLDNLEDLVANASKIESNNPIENSLIENSSVIIEDFDFDIVNEADNLEVDKLEADKSVELESVLEENTNEIIDEEIDKETINIEDDTEDNKTNENDIAHNDLDNLELLIADADLEDTLIETKNTDDNNISIENLEEILLNHHEVNTDNVYNIDNENEIINDNLSEIEKDTIQASENVFEQVSEQVSENTNEEKKIDILSEVNQRLANAEYSWEEVERLLNENDTKNDIKVPTLEDNPIENNQNEIEDEPAQTSLLPVSETLAKIYETQEAYEDSIKIYKKLIIKNPEKTDLYNRNIKRIKKIIKKLEKKQK